MDGGYPRRVEATSEGVAESLDVFFIEGPDQLTRLVVLIRTMSAAIPASPSPWYPPRKGHAQPFEQGRKLALDLFEFDDLVHERTPVLISGKADIGKSPERKWSERPGTA